MTDSFNERLNQLKNRIGVPTICLGWEDIEPINWTDSYWGGMPYQPDDSSLPQHPVLEIPLTFIAQINFAEIRQQHPDFPTTLPEKGLLQLFSLEPEKLENLIDPDDTNLRWYPDIPIPTTRYVPAVSTSPLGLPHAARRMTFTINDEVTEGDLYESGLFTSIEIGHWRRSGRAPVHHLLGKPDSIQYDPRLAIVPPELQHEQEGLLTLFLPRYRRKVEQREAQKEVQRQIIMAEWDILWQIGWDEQLAYYWFDGGRVYIMVNKAALHQNDLSNLIVDMQTF